MICACAYIILFLFPWTQWRVGVEDGHGFFNTPLTESVSTLLESELALWHYYFNQYNMEEVVLYPFLGPGLKGLPVSTSCLLEQSLWEPWIAMLKVQLLWDGHAGENTCGYLRPQSQLSLAFHTILLGNRYVSEAILDFQNSSYPNWIPLSDLSQCCMEQTHYPAEACSVFWSTEPWAVIIWLLF